MKGWLGEKLTALGIWMHLDKETYRRFHNVIVPARNGTTQIDHVIVSPYGIFVVETKNYQGWIFGSANQAQWTQSIYGKKHRFQNPLRQNYRHIKCLSDYLDLPEDRFHSVVFFIGDCKLKTENRTLARITPKRREEQRLYDAVALREAVINAIVHNDYSYEGVPKFELFADRLEITSTGGMPQGVTREEFFQGYSIPRNKELMRIFRDLDMVEYLGSGMPRILRAYSQEVFHFTENFIRIVLPSAKPEDGQRVGEKVGTTQKTTQKKKTTPQQIIALLRENPEMSRRELAEQIKGISEDGIKYQLDRLKTAGIIKRVGPDKGGHWEVLT